MIIWLPLLVALVGLLMYVLCANPKLSEIGRLMFFVGLLVTLFQLPQHTVNLLGR